MHHNVCWWTMFARSRHWSEGTVHCARHGAFLLLRLSDEENVFFLISRNDSELYTWNMSNMSIFSVLEFEENNLRSLGAAKCCILTNLSDFSKQEYFRFWTIWLLSFHIFRQSLRVSSYGLSNFKPGHSCGIFLLSRTKVLVILHQPGFFFCWW